jgi:monoamine oxidase
MRARSAKMITAPSATGATSAKVVRIRARPSPWRRQRAAISTRATADADVVVVGAGLAGLTAAAKLHKQGLKTILIEASDGVGGRVRTDVHPEGFLLDRGFQIFLAGYPTTRATLDYPALDLKPFYAGAMVRESRPSTHKAAHAAPPPYHPPS